MDGMCLASDHLGHAHSHRQPVAPLPIAQATSKVSLRFVNNADADVVGQSPPGTMDIASAQPPASGGNVARSAGEEDDVGGGGQAQCALVRRGGASRSRCPGGGGRQLQPFLWAGQQNTLGALSTPGALLLPCHTHTRLCQTITKTCSNYALAASV